MNAVPSVQVDNARVIVTEWRFAPGAETGHHVHAHDYVVVPLTSGVLRLVEATGVRDVSLHAAAEKVPNGFYALNSKKSVFWNPTTPTRSTILSKVATCYRPASAQSSSNHNSPLFVVLLNASK